MCCIYILRLVHKPIISLLSLSAQYGYHYSLYLALAHTHADVTNGETLIADTSIGSTPITGWRMEGETNIYVDYDID